MTEAEARRKLLRKAQNARYYQRHRAKLLERNADWNARNPDRRKALNAARTPRRA